MKKRKIGGNYYVIVNIVEELSLEFKKDLITKKYKWVWSTDKEIAYKELKKQRKK